MRTELGLAGQHHSRCPAKTPGAGIYLPMSELRQFDVKAHEILKREYSDRFTR
jgi:hypothetical protein